MFQALKANKQQLIDKKKSAVKFTDDISFPFVMDTEETTKKEPADLELGDYIYPIINTTKYLDSHHDLSIGKVISYPDEVELMVKDIAWKSLGKDYSGNTQALIFKSKLTDASNSDAFTAFKKNKGIQNSVRMLYISLDLAINDNSTDFKAEKRNWEKYYPMIANKEVADERGYFWVISEAKIYKEGSAVLFGSNDATPVEYEEPKHIEPLTSTQPNAAKSTLLSHLTNLEKTFKQITK
jgi:hypothetical protein